MHMFCNFIILLTMLLSTAVKDQIEASIQAQLISPGKYRHVNQFLLITGCGRSGTKYITKVLQESGIGVVHEHGMGPQGCVSWLMAAEVDWAPWGPLSKNFSFKHIFHQVRDPIKVIQSVYNFQPLVGWKWICRVIPQILITDNNITKSAKYWYYWNLMTERKAEWTYRVEDIDTVYQQIGKKLGFKFPNKVPNISRKTNTKGKPKQVITWDFLKSNLDPNLFQKVHDLAVRYGYNPT